MNLAWSSKHLEDKALLKHFFSDCLALFLSLSFSRSALTGSADVRSQNAFTVLEIYGVDMSG